MTDYQLLDLPFEMHTQIKKYLDNKSLSKYNKSCKLVSCYDIPKREKKIRKCGIHSLVNSKIIHWGYIMVKIRNWDCEHLECIETLIRSTGIDIRELKHKDYGNIYLYTSFLEKRLDNIKFIIEEMGLGRKDIVNSERRVMGIHNLLCYASWDIIKYLVDKHIIYRYDITNPYIIGYMFCNDLSFAKNVMSLLTISCEDLSYYSYQKSIFSIYKLFDNLEIVKFLIEDCKFSISLINKSLLREITKYRKCHEVIRYIIDTYNKKCYIPTVPKGRTEVDYLRILLFFHSIDRSYLKPSIIANLDTLMEKAISEGDLIVVKYLTGYLFGSTQEIVNRKNRYINFSSSSGKTVITNFLIRMNVNSMYSKHNYSLKLSKECEIKNCPIERLMLEYNFICKVNGKIKRRRINTFINEDVNEGVVSDTVVESKPDENYPYCRSKTKSGKACRNKHIKDNEYCKTHSIKRYSNVF